MNIEQVWPEWQVDRLIGKGSYGAVYRCFKAGATGKEYAAVKVISVPQDDYEAASIGSELPSGEQSREYYKDITDNFITEIKILEALKDEKHIVNIQDSKVVEKDDGIGWQIFIRMELLTDFNTWASDKTLSADDVKKLALDLCDALIVCGKKRIVHRDIKPENIFVDTEGNFKLGDFGVAKQLEKTYASMSTKGTYNYMAPEVVASKKYDSRADIYSLGLVMYKLLNNNRLPFLDPDKKLIRFNERQEAFERRIKGEKIPPLAGVDDDLNEIILKACEFRPEDRYRTVEEFRSALAKEKPSNRFVRLVKKHKVVSAIVFLLVVSIVSGSCGYGFAAMKERTRAYPEKHFALGILENVVSLNGVGIVSDSTGVRVVYETEGREEYLTNREAKDLAFDGKRVCYTYENVETGNCELFMADCETGEVSFSIPSKYDLDPVFFDETYLYFFKNTLRHCYLYKYSFENDEYHRLYFPPDYYKDLFWSIEEVDGHFILFYEVVKTNSYLYAEDIYSFVEEGSGEEAEPTPIADSYYVYLGTINGYVYTVAAADYYNAEQIKEYFANKYKAIQFLLRRNKYGSSESEEVLQMDYKKALSLFGYDKESETKFECYISEGRGLLPLDRTFVGNDKSRGIKETVYDIFTQKVYQFIISSDVESITISTRGRGVFTYTSSKSDTINHIPVYEVGYIVPVSESSIWQSSKPSKMYPVGNIYYGEPSYWTSRNGIYVNSNNDRIDFIRVNFKKE